MVGLVELAQRYVSLSAELEKTRNAMRAALLNGSNENPTKAGSSGPPNKRINREAFLAQSKVADERMLALLRQKPMRPNEIAKATRGKLSTTRERLRRLHKRGAVEPAAEGWRLTGANPTTPPSL
jgi:tRNA(Ile)-lysidine synthase TilS/MesJ